MRRLTVPLLLLAAAALGAFAQNAAAANTVVNVGNGRTLSPTSVSIAPADTVTWTWVGPDTDHRVAASPAGQAETWDSGNEDLRSVGSTFVKTFTTSGTYSYVCLVHPDDMRGTVRVGLPTATLDASVTNPFTDEAITLTATASDPGGTIVNYEWDLNGDTVFELDTDGVSSTPASFPAAGSVTTRVRVTDDDGNVAIVPRAITVRSRVPASSFTAPATVFRSPAAASFDAAASLPNNGTIDAYEWDLDGDAAEDFDPPGTSSTAQASFTTLGAKTIRLRVTDSEGLTHKTTRTVTVVNQLPTASFTAANTGMDFTFNGAASSDPEGSALTYAWDLDGNTTFETSTGTTPSAAQTYTTGGARTVRLRVTDADTGTAVATQSITVPAPPAPPVPPATPAPPAPPAPAQPAAPIATVLTPAARPIASAIAPRPLTLAASAAPGRRKPKAGKVGVVVRCDAACAVTATGSLVVGGRTLRLGRVTRAVAAGRAATLTLSVSRRDLARLRRARRASATVTVSAPGIAPVRVRISLR